MIYNYCQKLKSVYDRSKISIEVNTDEEKLTIKVEKVLILLTVQDLIFDYQNNELDAKESVKKSIFDRLELKYIYIPCLEKDFDQIADYILFCLEPWINQFAEKISEKK